MIHVSPENHRRCYGKPFPGLTEAGFGSELEMECLCGLIRAHLESNRGRFAGRRPRLFEIGTHRGAWLCHFHAMAPELELHSLNVLPSQLAASARQMPGEILEEKEIGVLARERGIAYTQHLEDSRRFSWDTLAGEGRFEIVFIDGCHESFTVLADTLNALRIMEPGGLLVWHDCKAIDEPGRSVLAALHDLDAHEFAGSIRHIERTWLAFAQAPEPAKAPDSLAVRSINRDEPIDQAMRHLALERRASLPEKVSRLPIPCEVVFFSNHHRPEWPDEATLGAVPDSYVVSRDPRRVARADIVVFHLPDTPAWYRLPRRKHQVWIGVTVEPDAYYPWQADPDKLATLDLLFSHHPHADFPLHYAPIGSLATLRQPPPSKSPDHVLCAFISNPRSLSGRERLVEAFERHLPVHHFGRWHHNQPEPPSPGRAAKLEILRQYHFCLAIENSLETNLVTEKWYDCLVAGCVPVYLGAPNIAEFLPGPGCFIDLREGRPVAEIARRLLSAAACPREYQRYFDWKNSMASGFVNRIGDEARPPGHGLMSQIESAIRQARPPGLL